MKGVPMDIRQEIALTTTTHRPENPAGPARSKARLGAPPRWRVDDAARWTHDYFKIVFIIC